MARGLTPPPPPAPAAAPGCGRYALAPALAAVGAYGGTAWVVRSWASCPLGNDAGGNVGLKFLMLVMWCGLTVALLLLQLVLRRWPLPGGRAVAWLAPAAAALVLTLLYRWGMEWPRHTPGVPCTDGYPVFPFTGKTGPGAG
ncbi:hypothetical protein [Streptomyces sp. VRA16 Mangrove soil]|uniref:hypothetical protein n=1 Tax=Streptomyces sp. VRA16 Mangrove soil TaxID=2817434 RepID=UPI001A9CF399|nr:hypothetical protein [Streptomyces sp. VRA16 Mangrove soil]MBO1335471.1 hypothetical protein [Streptomyces sp. VRA16 Mangrove soil]